LLSPLCRSVLQVSVLYMSRIGEILSLKIKHVVHPDRVICEGSKKSNGYLIYLPGLSSQINEWEYKTKETLLFPISYMKVYRACIKSSILINDGFGGNSMKCHAHRYLFARKEFNSQGANNIKIALHHKSIKSQRAYLTKNGMNEKMIALQTELDLTKCNSLDKSNLLAPGHKTNDSQLQP